MNCSSPRTTSYCLIDAPLGAERDALELVAIAAPGTDVARVVFAEFEHICMSRRGASVQRCGTGRAKRVRVAMVACA